MKVLFAVSNDNITTSVVNKYQQKYKEIVTTKSVYYFNAIVNELKRDKEYTAIVIEEDLEPISNNNYEKIDKFLAEKLDNISDEASRPTGEDIPIILICSDRRTKSDQLLRQLFSMGIYNALVGNDRSLDKVCDLMKKPRNKKDAKQYYEIETDQVEYESHKDEIVSEEQIQSILNYYKKIGANEKKCVQAFDRISKQYDNTQLRIIVKFLPIDVKAILEAYSPVYQKLMSNGTVLSNGKYNEYKVNNPKKPENIDFITKDVKEQATNIGKPVVIPSNMQVKPENEYRDVDEKQPLTQRPLERNQEAQQFKDKDRSKIMEQPQPQSQQNHPQQQIQRQPQQQPQQIQQQYQNQQIQQPNQNRNIAMQQNYNQQQMPYGNMGQQQYNPYFGQNMGNPYGQQMPYGNMGQQQYNPYFGQNMGQQYNPYNPYNQNQQMNNMQQMPQSNVQNQHINNNNNNIKSVTNNMEHTPMPEPVPVPMPGTEPVQTTRPVQESVQPIKPEPEPEPVPIPMPGTEPVQTTRPVQESVQPIKPEPVPIPMPGTESVQTTRPVQPIKPEPVPVPELETVQTTKIAPVPAPELEPIQVPGTAPISVSELEPIDLIEELQPIEPMKPLEDEEKSLVEQKNDMHPIAKTEPQSIGEVKQQTADFSGNLVEPITEETTPVKRKRGRPRKIRPEDELGISAEPPVKRKRGRPRKIRPEEELQNEIVQPQEPVVDNLITDINNQENNENVIKEEPIQETKKEDGINLYDLDINDTDNTNELDELDNTIDMHEPLQNQAPAKPSIIEPQRPTGLGETAQSAFIPNNNVGEITQSVFNSNNNMGETSQNVFSSNNNTMGINEDAPYLPMTEEQPQTNAYSNMFKPEPVAQNGLIKDIKANAEKMQNMPITGHGKTVAFVGTSKNGTSFIVNNIALLLSQSGIKTAVVDLTGNKNSYYMFTDNDANKTKIATESLKELSFGRINGLSINNNLTVFTALPGDKSLENINNENVLRTISNGFEVVLLDCDYTTDLTYFANANEVYIVQSMDALTIQPLTKFLSELKAKNILDENKIRIVINKHVKLKKINTKMIVGGMSTYNEPSMTLQRDLFNPKKVQVLTVPFDDQTYSKYLESIAMCELTLNGYSKEVLESLEKLKNVVYPLIAGGNRIPNANIGYNNNMGMNNPPVYPNQINSQPFSNNMNETLNRMRNNNY